MSKSLTNEEKHYAAATDPLYEDSPMTKKRLDQILKRACGKYWDANSDWARRHGCEFEEFVAFTPKGKRAFFEYNWSDPSTKAQQKRWKKEARLAAKLWTKGKREEAKIAHGLSYEHADLTKYDLESELADYQ